MTETRNNCQAVHDVTQLEMSLTSTLSCNFNRCADSFQSFSEQRFPEYSKCRVLNRFIIETAVFYKDFYHREMWYLNTRKNTTFLHVKISIISLTSGLSLKLYLNSLVYHRNIFGSS